jgi:hypothetical protein
MSSLSSVFNFSPRRVFSLTGGQLAVYHWRSGALSDPLVFPADEDGLRSFNEYLMRSPGLPAYLLVDFVEEEFRQESIPHVFGSDRRALVRTRQARLFRDARYTGAIMQGRETEGRRDDSYLFTALIRSELLAPWLSPIMKAKVPLAGIYSVPILSPLILPKLPTSNRDVLLVTLQASGGLRQTFMSNGHLKISRLAMAPRLDPGQHASYLLTEVEKLRRYLFSLRMLEPGAPLDVVLLTGGSLAQDLRSQAKSTAEVEYHVLDVASVASDFKLEGKLRGAYADPLFVHLLARETPTNHYARAEDTRYIRHHRARSAMSVVSVLALLASITYSGFQFIESVLIKREANGFEAQAGFYEERYNLGRTGLLASYGKAGLKKVVAQPFELRQAVQLVETLKLYKADPLVLMVRLSEGLARHERIQIERMDWAVSLDPNAEVAEGGGIKPKPKNFRAIPTSSPVANEKGAYFQLALIAGRIDPFDGDYRDALERVNRFAAALNELDQVHDVRLTRLPFDASSRRRLSGSAVQSKLREQANFELNLVVKVAGKPKTNG